MKYLLMLVVLIVLAVPSAAQQRALKPLSEFTEFAGPKPKADQATVNLYARSFGEIVFRREFKAGPSHLAKWSGRLSFQFDDRMAKHRKEIRLMLFTLRDLTGLEFTGGGGRDAPVIVYHPTTIEHDKNCAAVIHEDKPGIIVSAKINVGQNIPGIRLTECVWEEFSQILGALNDQTLVEASLFNDSTNGRWRRLTWHDAIILRTLYHPSLKPGMTREEAMPLVRPIIRRLLKELNE